MIILASLALSLITPTGFLGVLEMLWETGTVWLLHTSSILPHRAFLAISEAIQFVPTC